MGSCYLWPGDHLGVHGKADEAGAERIPQRQRRVQASHEVEEVPDMRARHVNDRERGGDARRGRHWAIARCLGRPVAERRKLGEEERPSGPW